MLNQVLFIIFILIIYMYMYMYGQKLVKTYLSPHMCFFISD